MKLLRTHIVRVTRPILTGYLNYGSIRWESCYRSISLLHWCICLPNCLGTLSTCLSKSISRLKNLPQHVYSSWRLVWARWYRRSATEVSLTLQYPQVRFWIMLVVNQCRLERTSRGRNEWAMCIQYDDGKNKTYHYRESNWGPCRMDIQDRGCSHRHPNHMSV